ncbi:MAG: AAA family ATPase [Aestuariivirgaceae bacterium]
MIQQSGREPLIHGLGEWDMPEGQAVSEIRPPSRPSTVEETGIENAMLLSLVVKAMYTLGLERASTLSEHVKLSASIVTTILEEMNDLALVESRGLAGSDLSSELRYSLSDKGKAWALDAMRQSQYIGPAPVPLDDFCNQVYGQRVAVEHIGPKILADSLSDLILSKELIQQIGPAANSAKSILLYGPPGNGKTRIAEAIGASFNQTIYIPYSIEIGGQIINFFDPTVHEPVGDFEDTPETESLVPRGKLATDARWVPCRRPVVKTGGELTLDQLELQYSPSSKFYEAPLHLKALGGVFVVDDFGRQKDSPQSILNRWIVPLEREVDYLTLHTGKKFPIPFDELVIFSTNIPPAELTDEAALRRLYYKIEVPKPTREDFVTIFKQVCADSDIEYSDTMVKFLFKERYDKLNEEPSAFHPRFFIDQVISMCEYYEIPVQVNKETLAHAWRNFYVSYHG